MRHNSLHVFVLPAIGLLLVVDAYMALRLLSPRMLEVSFLEVGNGVAALVRTPSGAVVLINGGPDASILRELGTSLPFWKRRIAAVVATSARVADSAGLADVFARYPAARVLHVAEFETRSSNATHELLAEGQRFEMGGGAYADVLYVSESASVVRISYGAISFLFSGDLSREARLKLHARYAATGLLASDVYVVPHEGAPGVVDTEWLRAIGPAYAVISVNAENRYGYPDDRTLQTLGEVGAKILRTDQEGRIEFISDGLVLERK